MHFLSDFEAASQGILKRVGQEAASEYGEKGAKSDCKEYWDRFTFSVWISYWLFEDLQS